MEKSKEITFDDLGKFIAEIPTVKSKTHKQVLLWIFEELGEVSRTLNRPERENPDSLTGEMTDFLTLVAALCHRLNITFPKIIKAYNTKAEAKNREVIT